MLAHLKFRHILCTVQSSRPETLTPFTHFIRYCHFQSTTGFNSSNPSSCLAPKKISENSVAIFWDLDTRPPKSVSPYKAAVKLKTAASSFGIVRHMIAYANRNALNYVPQVIWERKERNRVVIRDGESNICPVCGRRFYTNEKLMNHFKQIHETEHVKRLNQIESARGSRRVKLVGKYSMKMEKYKNAARDVLTTKVGRGLADEVEQAGFWIRSVLDKPQGVKVALRNHIVDMMDHRRVDCLMLVSDDSHFVDVVMEAKLRCLKTVVVGDFGDGALKRAADSGFSWNEILIGKAEKEAVSVVGKWKDRDVLKRLEWTCNSDGDQSFHEWNDEVYGESERLEWTDKSDGDQSLHKWNDEVYGESEDDDIEGFVGEANDNLGKDDACNWWELDSDSEAISLQSSR
ncbi:hypothetical protein ACFX2I_047297 [Malus domestica]